MGATYEAGDEREVDPFEHSLQRIAVTTIAVGEIQHALDMAALTPRGWHAGPLPLELRLPGEASIRADAEARATYLDSHVVGAVLGGSAPAWRAWTWLTPAGATRHGASIWAVEVLRLPRFDERPPRRPSIGTTAAPCADFAVLLHASVVPDGRSICDVLLAARDVVPDAVAAIPMIASMQVVKDRGRPDVFRSIMVTTADGSLQPLAAPDGPATDNMRHWLFSFASATLPRRLAAGRIADFEADDQVLNTELPASTVVYPSADWRIGVLRSGAAFVGCRADRGSITAASGWSTALARQSDGEFLDAGELYVHTIYADVFLLGTLQRHCLRELRELVSDASNEADDFRSAQHLATTLATFRERFWWTDAARGGIGDRLLRAYQDQHSLPALFDQVTSDAQGIFQRTRLVAEQRASGALAVLSLLTVVSVVAALARPFVATGTGDPLEATSIVVAISGLIAFLLLVFLPGMRGTIRLARPDRRRRTRSRTR